MGQPPARDSPSAPQPTEAALAAVPWHRAPVPGPGRLGRDGGGGGRGGALRAAGEQRGRGGASALPGGDAGGPAAVSASPQPARTARGQALPAKPLPNGQRQELW